MIRAAAEAAGRVACEVLAEAREARCVGSTSRGLFVRAAGSRWVLFLSCEPWMGPLTVRLSMRIPAFEAGTPGRIEAGRLLLPGLEVRVPPEARWECPAPTGRPSPPAERLEALAAEARRSPRGLGPALDVLLGLEAPAEPPEGAALLRLAREPGLDAAAALLGLGRGLTPSGDDALAGYLLASSRWLGGRPWTPALVEEAHRRTTALSASLLELAAGGEGDERILALVDFAMAGGERPTGWLDWGSSSGVDALAGVAAASVARSS